MKKYYEAPSVEKVAFAYRDQVVVASNGGTRCTQDWDGLESVAEMPQCRYSPIVPDSGLRG